MSRTFAYCRVSTLGQTTDNQVGELEAAGFKLEPHRVVGETISGSSPIAQRKQFLRLLDRLERDDVLVVTRMDRLGRNAADVATTVAKLAEMGVRVHCLQLGGADLTSAAGRMIMGMVNTFAEFERDLLVERTQAGLQRAKAQGKKLGRPAVLDPAQQQQVQEKMDAGTTISALSREFGTSRKTIVKAAGPTVYERYHALLMGAGSGQISGAPRPSKALQAMLNAASGLAGPVSIEPPRDEDPTKSRILREMEERLQSVSIKTK